MPSTKSPFLLRSASPASCPGALEQVAGPAGELAQACLERILEVRALGGAAGALLGAGLLARLERGQPFLEGAELAGHLVAELVERRALAGRVQEAGELRGVPVEVAAQQLAQLAHGALAAVRVEQLAHQAAQLALVAQERFQGAGQAAVAIGEVGAQLLLQGLGGPGVGLLQALGEAGELGADDIGRQADAGVADGLQADVQRALHQAGPLIGFAVRDEGGQLRVVELQVLDDDAVRPDGYAAFHEGSVGMGCDTLRVAIRDASRCRAHLRRCSPDRRAIDFAGNPDHARAAAVRGDPAMLRIQPRRALGVIVATGLLVSVLGVPSVAACTGGPLLAEGETYQSVAEVIFTGTAVRVDDPRSSFDAATGSTDPMAWTFAVDGVEKGDVGARFTITTPRDDASCGYGFSLGGRYRVYAWGSADGHHQVTQGNGTEVLTSLPNPPSVEGSFRAVLPSALMLLAWAAGALLLIGVVGIASRRFGWFRRASA